VVGRGSRWRGRHEIRVEVVGRGDCERGRGGGSLSGGVAVGISEEGGRGGGDG